MGQILDTKRITNNKMKLKLLLDLKEILLLQGCTNGTHLFSSDNHKEKAWIMETGTKKSVKYFVIPQKFILRLYKKKKKFIEYVGSCQRIDNQNKIFFIYILKKIEEGCLYGH